VTRRVGRRRRRPDAEAHAGAPPRLQPVPVAILDGRAHVMVDGAPRPGTALTLSHWPGTPTPEDLWDDLSAGICLRARARPDVWPDGCALVTVDHHDVDGVISLALVSVDGLADAHGELLVEAARVGDFGVVTRRDAAQVAFALDTVADAEAGRDLVPVLAADPEAHERRWGAQLAAYDAACRALAEGWATLEEHPEHDLVVVTVDGRHPDAPGASWEGAPLHRAAVCSATDRLRVLTVDGGRMEVRYRYESWVRLRDRRPRRRVDLDALAAELTACERHGARWRFDGAGAITGALHLEGDAVSSIAAGEVVERVRAALHALDRGMPAWDPYAPAAPARAGTQ
jgi:hypothetical protein